MKLPRQHTIKNDNPSPEYLAGFAEAEKHFANVIVFATCYIAALEKMNDFLEGQVNDLLNQGENGNS